MKKSPATLLKRDDVRSWWVAPKADRAGQTNPLRAEITILIEEINRQPPSALRDNELAALDVMLNAFGAVRLRPHNPTRDELAQGLEKIFLGDERLTIFPGFARRFSKVLALTLDAMFFKLARFIKEVGYDYEFYQNIEEFCLEWEDNFCNKIGLSPATFTTFLAEVAFFARNTYNIEMVTVNRSIIDLESVLGIKGEWRRQLFAKEVFDLAARVKAAKRQSSSRIGRQQNQPSGAVALMEDKTLGRLRQRYDQRLASIELPAAGFATKEQAQAAGRLSATYRDLSRRLLARGLEPLPKDARVVEAERLGEAFYRNARKPSL